MKRKTNNSGITLIALVVTIIILMILAAVGISMGVSKNGILTRAKTAASQMDKEAGKERMNAIILASQIEFYQDNNKMPNLEELAEVLSEKDDEIEYISTVHRPIAKIDLPTDIGTASVIYVKLKGSGLEFKIGEDLKVAEVLEVGETPGTPTGNGGSTGGETGGEAGGEDGEETQEPNSGTLKVGDTVNYTPAEATFTDWISTRCNSWNQAIKNYTLSNTDDNYKITEWTVSKIDGDNIELMSKKPTTGSVFLGGALGYSNAVLLLNNACRTLYSDTSKGIQARSIKIEDIEERMTDDALTGENGVYTYSTETTDSLYGTQPSSAYTGSPKYPDIYSSEKDSVINGTRKTTGLGRSEQTSYYSADPTRNTWGYSTASSIQAFESYWQCTHEFMLSAFKGTGTGTSNTNYNVIMPDDETSSYWVATRCIFNFNNSALNPTSPYISAYFYVHDVEGGRVTASSLSSSKSYDGAAGYAENHIRPVLTLTKDIITKVDGNWTIE